MKDSKILSFLSGNVLSRISGFAESPPPPDDDLSLNSQTPALLSKAPVPAKSVANPLRFDCSETEAFSHQPTDLLSYSPVTLVTEIPPETNPNPLLTTFGPLRSFSTLRAERLPSFCLVAFRWLHSLLLFEHYLSENRSLSLYGRKRVKRENSSSTLHLPDEAVEAKKHFLVQIKRGDWDSVTLPLFSTFRKVVNGIQKQVWNELLPSTEKHFVGTNDTEKTEHCKEREWRRTALKMSAHLSKDHNRLRSQILGRRPNFELLESRRAKEVQGWVDKALTRFFGKKNRGASDFVLKQLRTKKFGEMLENNLRVIFGRNTQEFVYSLQKRLLFEEFMARGID